MTKKSLLLSLCMLTTITTQSSNDFTINITVESTSTSTAQETSETTNHTDPARWQELYKVYIPTFVISGLVGASTSGILRYIEKNYPQISRNFIMHLLILITEIQVRNTIIDELQSDFDTYSIKYKKNLMHPTARIASWIAYLAIK